MAELKQAGEEQKANDYQRLQTPQRISLVLNEGGEAREKYEAGSQKIGEVAEQDLGRPGAGLGATYPADVFHASYQKSSRPPLPKRKSLSAFGQ